MIFIGDKHMTEEPIEEDEYFFNKSINTMLDHPFITLAAFGIVTTIVSYKIQKHLIVSAIVEANKKFYDRIFPN